MKSSVFRVVVLLLVATTFGQTSPSIPDEELDRILDDAEKLFETPAESVHSRNTRSDSTRLYRKNVKPLALKYGQKAAAFAHASTLVSEKFGISHSDADRLLETRATSRQNVDMSAICSRTFTCNAPYPYRTPDGVCNNLNNPGNGMAISRFDRMVSPDYDDGVQSLRQSSGNGFDALWSPRIVSLLCHNDTNIPHQTVTHLTMYFGQFIDHDMTSTPEFQNFPCCSNPTLPQCMPIQVPTNDPWYGQFGISCLDVGRSIPSCGTGVREQINQVSAYLDASQIYGSSQNEQNALRASNGYQLLTDTNTQLLPKDFQAPNCGNPSANIICFKAGDDRVNENPGLTAMHTLWMREHNRIAQILFNLNPSWTTELIYQESKRIVTAELQNIVYREWLPVILGQTTMTNFGLNLPNPGVFTTYDSTVRAVIFNEFATAAFRFGHTLIQNFFSLTGTSTIPLQDNFQNPQIIYQSAANIDRLLLGGTTQPAQAYDNLIAQAVTRHLMQRPPNQFGSDLAALNIQRGRDHGIPGWTAFRSSCGLSVPQSFNDLTPIYGTSQKVDGVFNAYALLSDIDLWTGGVHETPVSGGVVGPTFACIIARQFQRLFKGDRFFHAHGGQTGSFRSPQLANIGSRTLGSVMCDNNAISDTQANVFLLGQTRITCSSQVKLNLNGWIPAGF